MARQRKAQDFTEADWRKEIESLMSAVGDKGLTVRELADEVGMSIQVCRACLRTLKSQGKLQVGTGRRESLDGRMLFVPVYSLRRRS